METKFKVGQRVRTTSVQVNEPDDNVTIGEIGIVLSISIEKEQYIYNVDFDRGFHGWDVWDVNENELEAVE